MPEFPEVAPTEETVELTDGPRELGITVDPDLPEEERPDSWVVQSDDSLLTVLVALVANALVAVAKSVAAGLTGSASMVAEAAHSWADTGNEIFLLVADRRSKRDPDDMHPLGYGREAYVWSMFAAMGIFIAGAAVSITHGIQELLNPEPADNFTIGYIVLAVSFVLEGTSFLQSVRQARAQATRLHRDLLEHILATSDPTLRAVFAEDGAALVGLLIAAAGLLGHQLSGSAVPDALGSIAVGVVLGIVALILINRNRRFLIGQVADPRIVSATVASLLESPDIDRVTYLRLDIVGPQRMYLVADVDLVGDDVEHRIAVRLRTLEARICESPAVVAATLSLSAPDEPSLVIPERPQPRRRRGLKSVDRPRDPETPAVR